MAIESQPRTTDVVTLLREQHNTIRRLIAEIRRGDAEEATVFPALDVRCDDELRRMATALAGVPTHAPAR